VERDEAYQVLSDLIFKGFLVAEAPLAGRRFVFKTVNDNEFDLIRLLSNENDSLRFNANFLALSLFSVDGDMLLPQRNLLIPDMRDLFLGLPSKFLSQLITNLNVIRNVVFDATGFIEGFCYTALSRRSWNTLKGITICDERATGIPGTSGLGLNVHQDMWMSINQTMDDDEAYDRQFNMSLMVASAMNPKGASHLRNQHTTMMKSVESRRIELAKIGRPDARAWTPEGWSAPVDTAEQLVAELERQMQGKKDRHDEYMESYMKRLHEQAENRAKEAEARIKRAREGLEDVFITGETRVLTPEETESMLRRRYRKTTIGVADEDKVDSVEKDRFMKKIGNRVLTARGV